MKYGSKRFTVLLHICECVGIARLNHTIGNKSTFMRE